MVSRISKARVLARRAVRAGARGLGVRTFKPLERKNDREERQALKNAWHVLKTPAGDVALLTAAHRRLVEQSLQTVVESPHAIAKPLLFELMLDSNEPRVQLQAAKSLKDTHGVDVDKVLEKQVNQRSNKVERIHHAALTYVQLHGASAVPKLSEWLAKTEWPHFAQKSLIVALGETRDASALKALDRYATPHSLHIQLVLDALEKINHPNALVLAVRTVAADPAHIELFNDEQAPGPDHLAAVEGDRMHKQVAGFVARVTRNPEFATHPDVQRAKLLTSRLARTGNDGEGFADDPAFVNGILHLAFQTPLRTLQARSRQVRAAFAHFRRDRSLCIDEPDHVVLSSLRAALNPARSKTFQNGAGIQLYYKQLRAKKPEQVK